MIITTNVSAGPGEVHDDGRSTFEELEIPLAGPEPLQASEQLPAVGVHFIESIGEGQLFSGNAPRRLFVLLLQGMLEVEAGDGSVRRVGPGDVLLADDTTGKGHILRGVESPRRAIFVTVPDDFDEGRFRP